MTIDNADLQAKARDHLWMHFARQSVMEDGHGVPIIVCQLHSQVGVIAAVLGELCPDARVAYVMTDGAALPLVLSDLVDDLCRSGLIDVTITEALPHSLRAEVALQATPA